MSDDEWHWQFRTPAKRTYDDLDEHAQDRITDKLDAIVTDQWRDPDEYHEPLTAVARRKPTRLRVWMKPTTGNRSTLVATAG